MGVLDGKVAIITGGGRGLGKAMALGMIAEGARVTITGSSGPDEDNSVAEQANQKAGVEVALPAMADVTREEDCRRTLEATLSTFGGLHVLVNNAGLSQNLLSDNFRTDPVKFWAIDGATWKRVIDTNINGPFLMAKTVLPHLVGQSWGRIIQISTNHQTMRRPGYSPYGPTKAALETEVVIWARELEGTGITVNSLRPGGATDTAMIPYIPGGDRSDLLSPQVMVAPAVWLASDASGHATSGRYCGADWDPNLTPAEAVKQAYQPAGWTESDDG